MSKLSAKDEKLAKEVQSAIDAGKDISETEPSIDQRRKERMYRKTVPFTHEEALQVALNALQAYFVEQALFVDSAAGNFKKAAIAMTDDWFNFGFTDEGAFLEGNGEVKPIVIELKTETQLDRTGVEAMQLVPQERSKIEAQKYRLDDLRRMVDFKENKER